MEDVNHTITCLMILDHDIQEAVITKGPYAQWLSILNPMICKREAMDIGNVSESPDSNMTSYMDSLCILDDHTCWS